MYIYIYIQLIYIVILRFAILIFSISILSKIKFEKINKKYSKKYLKVWNLDFLFVHRILTLMLQHGVQQQSDVIGPLRVVNNCTMYQIFLCKELVFTLTWAGNSCTVDIEINDMNWNEEINHWSSNKKCPQSI